VRASQGFRSFDAATRTIQGIETVNMIRKGQVRWLEKGNIIGQIAFMAGLFGSDRRCLMVRTNRFSLSEFQVCNTSTNTTLVRKTDEPTDLTGFTL
jgi:hypothetical protein